jgi:hypothetical protein
MSESLRDSRRTSVITLLSAATGNLDQVRLCEPECRNEFLLDLGVPRRGRGGGWVYRSHGEADVTVAWSGVRFHVTWRRGRATVLPCDQCGDEWEFRMPELIARAAERSEALKGTLTAGLIPFSALGAHESASG